MLINGEQLAVAPDFMNMDISNVLNIGSLATVARSMEGGGGEAGVGKRDSGRRILISPHRSGKGQSEAHNRMHHVPLPCFTYSTCLESRSGALWFGSIKLVIITSVLFEDKPVMASIFTWHEAPEISNPLHDMLLHLWVIQNHMEVPHQLKSRFLFREVWFPSAAKKNPTVREGQR